MCLCWWMRQAAPYVKQFTIACFLRSIPCKLLWLSRASWTWRGSASVCLQAEKTKPHITCIINYFSPLGLIEMYVLFSHLPAAEERVEWIFSSCYIFLIYGRRFSENTLAPAETTDSNLLSSLCDIYTPNTPWNEWENTVMEWLRAS